jgi:hypothetical protein
MGGCGGRFEPLRATVWTSEAFPFEMLPQVLPKHRFQSHGNGRRVAMSYVYVKTSEASSSTGETGAYEACGFAPCDTDMLFHIISQHRRLRVQSSDRPHQGLGL